MTQYRRADRIVGGQDTVDGAGVHLKRLIGTQDLMQWDPFLLLDEFKNEDPSAYIAGFPDHPHRGFETVTYMLAGNFRHRDSKGHEGHLKAGSVQWMSAGRGIIHSEMPEQSDGLVWGYQLWLNLPAAHKMDPPHYQDIGPAEIPHVIQDNLDVKVIAGAFEGTAGPGQPPYPLNYFDVHLAAEGRFESPAPPNMNVFIYVYEGHVTSGPESNSSDIKQGQIALLTAGDAVLVNAGTHDARFLFAAAQRLEEPIVRRGPFVMNTMEQLQQAFTDYQKGVLDKP